MDAASPNVFLSLYEWRPRDRMTPAENFLTEALVYVLRTNVELRVAWVKLLTDRDPDPATIKIVTRASYDVVDGATIYPDIDICGRFLDKTEFTIIIENKWNSPYSKDQLDKYCLIIKDNINPFVVFICAAFNDYNQARTYVPPKAGIGFKALRWEDVYAFLNSAESRNGLLGELIEFMDRHALSARPPITALMIQAYLESRNFLSRLQRLAEKLLMEHEWENIPERNRASAPYRIRDVYGRVAIEFAPEDWNGAITIGFLYNNGDHGVPFADGTANSIDIMLRIEADPALGDRRTEVLKVLAARRGGVASAGGVVRLLGDRENKNRHTLFIVQRSLLDVIGEMTTEREQAQAIYNQANAWLEALFNDGQLAAALETLRRCLPKASRSMP
ncbi:PD-(D/E)XK nuclease family protein [Ancylobacter sp. WKF20]|uniref:PD-(D/E)XK nuclease family protein n=1 Tax=Ancylobacter sp. WKF20 TaxID=3039801 RepID=UPI0024344B71|nr:PD-(D/E)XK nuclease family protein [Ancylobacter sp. WKF20]WGD30168.1 PD-(D/E)XK nuclease family protein [Ancylobacter sp. WKF20]